MPTVKIIGRHRFFFFSKENNEPSHIHMESAENAAKFCPKGLVRLLCPQGTHSLSDSLLLLVEENVGFFLEKWYERPRNT